MALRESRRIEYIVVLLHECERTLSVRRLPLPGEGVKCFVTDAGLHLQLSLTTAATSYQTVTSAKKQPPIRTLTHLLPRTTTDPLVQGVKHRIQGSMITHTVKLPAEIVGCAIGMQERRGVLHLVQRMRQLLADLQPVSNRNLLSGRCRKPAVYNSVQLIEAACRHASHWGFNPSHLVHAYSTINTGRRRTNNHHSQLPFDTPSPPPSPSPSPPLLLLPLTAPFLDDPPDLVVPYDRHFDHHDNGTDHHDTDSRSPLTWDWVLPELPFVACADDEDNINDDKKITQQQQQQQQKEEEPQLAAVQCWDRLETQQYHHHHHFHADGVWMGSAYNAIDNDGEQLEHTDSHVMACEPQQLSDLLLVASA